jgi:hypothetical protein
LVRRQGRALVDHHPQHGVPAFRRVARTDAAQQRVTDIAVGFGQFLARSIRQLLAERRKRSAEQGSSQDQARFSGHGHPPEFALYDLRGAFSWRSSVILKAACVNPEEAAAEPGASRYSANLRGLAAI